MTPHKTSQAVIISDLHLNKNNLKTVQLFEKFLNQIAQYSNQLFILGDFFETWIGDDAMEDFEKKIAKLLLDLKNKSTKIFILPGNRDLLLGQKFCDLSGAELIKNDFYILPSCTRADTQVRPYTGEGREFIRIALCHGDEFCTSDIKYQKYRKIVHQKLVQFLFLNSPIFIRRFISQKIRQSSKTNYLKTQKIVDVSSAPIEKFAIENNINILIHGHTHQMGTHELTISPKIKPEKILKRIVNADWHPDHGSYVLIDFLNQVFLKDFP